jgi:hypothetical protein
MDLKKIKSTYKRDAHPCLLLHCSTIDNRNIENYPRCPSADEQLKKILCKIDTSEYYSTKRKMKSCHLQQVDGTGRYHGK